jgi:hypothetical protein
MFGLMMSEDTSGYTSLQGSGAGTTRFRCPDTLDLFGRVPAPANHSRLRLEVGKIGGKTFASISGLIGDGSSLNSHLLRSLVNRLPKLEIGSMKFAMTWKLWVTPSGRRFSRLAVSVKTMRALGFTLFATPTAKANQNCPSMVKWPGCRGIDMNPQTWAERMGYPAEWDACAPTATRSSRNSRPNS